MRKVAIGIVAVGLVASMGLAGCSKGDGAGADGSSASATYVSPLNDYMSALYEPPSEESQNAMNAKYNEILVQCMADQGFEYKADPSQNAMTYVDASESGIDQSSREFAVQYGYGISTNPWSDSSTAGPEDGSDGEWKDPNQEYVDSLSETARDAYYEALSGPPQEYDASSEDPSDAETSGSVAMEYRWEDNGCYGKAQHEAFEQGGSYWEDPKYSSLLDAVNELYNTQSSTPLMTELDSKWASCMSDAGYSSFSKPQDAMDSIQKKMEEFWNEDPTDGGTKELSDDEWAAFQSDQQKRISDEITAQELKLAVADWDCKDKIGYTKASDEARIKAEEDFIAQHKAELDELIAEHGTK